MNFLAHIYLSGKNLNILTGNFIADFIKGKQFLDFSPEIKQGIKLHREIDYFTDNHPTVAKSKERLRRKYRHYSGVIIDIFYDHFLASHWHEYHPTDLKAFTEQFYNIMRKQRQDLPDKVNYVLFHMEKGNWLYNYRTIQGISQTLYGMSRRTTFHSKMEESVKDLQEDYQAYTAEFQEFFPQLEQHSREYLKNNNLL